MMVSEGGGLIFFFLKPDMKPDMKTRTSHVCQDMYHSNLVLCVSCVYCAQNMMIMHQKKSGVYLDQVRLHNLVNMPVLYLFP